MTYLISKDEALTALPGAALMVHGGRTTSGYLFLETEAYDRDADLEFWVKKCLEYNPKVKASKKKAK